jgi:uncharacterized membrane protein YhaH (DUF805 family)
MMKNIISIYKKCLNFKGRSTRAEFYSFCLFVILSFILAFITVTEIQNLFGRTIRRILSCLCVIGIIVPFPALIVRRLHDGGHSAILPTVFVAVLPLFGLAEKLQDWGIVTKATWSTIFLCLVFVMLSSFIAIIVFLLIGKDKEDNKYGIASDRVTDLLRRVEVLEKNLSEKSEEEKSIPT